MQMRILGPTVTEVRASNNGGFSDRTAPFGDRIALLGLSSPEGPGFGTVLIEAFDSTGILVGSCSGEASLICTR